MLNVAIGWYVYAMTKKPISLAYVGLAQFLPIIVMVLIAGHVADRFDRRKIIGFSLLGKTICLAAFGIWSAWEHRRRYRCTCCFSSRARPAFSAPAMSATLPHLVSAEMFPRTVAAASSIFQICTIAGPAIGGLVYALGGPAVFAVITALWMLALTQLPRLSAGTRATGDHDPENAVTDTSILAGIRYIRSNRLYWD